MSKASPSNKPDNVPEAPPKAKKLRTSTTGHEINYLAYEVEATTAKTMRSLLLREGIAKAAILVKIDNVVGILISFKNWEQVAHFYEWSSKGDHIRQLMKTIRVPCGPIKVDTIAHSHANRIIEKLATAQTITRQDLEIDYDLEQGGNDGINNGSTSFYQVLLEGVFCHYCNMAHKPILPRY